MPRKEHIDWLEELERVAVQDGCRLLQVTEKNSITSKTLIDFSCQCGTVAIKSAWSFVYRGGGFCKACTILNTIKKINLSRAENLKSSSVQRSQTDTYVIYTDRYQTGELHLTDLVKLVVPPAIAKPKLVKSAGKVFKHGTTTWNFQTFTTVSEYFIDDAESSSKEKAAKRFDEQQLAHNPYVPENYVHTVQLKTILSDQAYFTRNFRLFIPSFDFPEVQLLIPPWILGVWLGDGSAGAPQVTNVDPAVLGGLQEYCQASGLMFTKLTNSITYSLVQEKTSRKVNGNTFFNALKALDLIENKHIPACYLKSSREQRLDLLAGLIDTDGSKVGEATFELCQSLDHETLYDDVMQLVTSLGFTMTKKKRVSQLKYRGRMVTCHSIRGTICGPLLHEVPTRINYKKIKEDCNRPRRDLLAFSIRHVEKNDQL